MGEYWSERTGGTAIKTEQKNSPVNIAWRGDVVTAPKTILVVEDSEVNRRLLSRILTARGYQILEAENGEIALNLLLSRDHPVSLVLLDLTMPVMDGYTLLVEMKKQNLLTTIPVIVTTGDENHNAEIRSLEYGASDFITKPYNAEIVCHRIESILRLCDNTALINRLEIDHLTRIYSREAFFQHAQMMLDENPQEQFQILCSNIENFKMINSKYGIRIGDKLLRYIAAHYSEKYGSSGVCGRIGGDSFAILLQSSRLPSQREVNERFAEAYQAAPVSNFVMKYGIYAVTDRMENVAEMCDRAQMALASVKHQYGVCYAVYDDAMRNKILREHQLTDYMEQALSKRQFVVYLQPKHDVETGKVAGAEALVRWIHPELGFISPNEFIPLFERNGFVSRLDLYVWENVCDVLQTWQEHGQELIPISVNASRVDFASENLAQQIAAMVDAHGVPHEMLHFEVTESAYTENPEQIISTVSKLRANGFLIEMDDFGSGYSSLNMLSELPIDILKLDMRFMQKKSNEVPDGKRSILSFVVSLSKWLQLSTVAEGVETADEVDLLRAIGCNYIQGYFFAKPMPVADFEEYLEADKKCKQNDDCQQEKSWNPALMSPPCVLVVDDMESSREILNQMLKSYYSVVTVCNGVEAYEYIKQHHKELSCILLDLLMPVMDGFQLIDCMRRDGFWMSFLLLSHQRRGRTVSFVRFTSERTAWLPNRTMRRFCSTM